MKKDVDEINQTNAMNYLLILLHSHGKVTDFFFDIIYFLLDLEDTISPPYQEWLRNKILK